MSTLTLLPSSLSPPPSRVTVRVDPTVGVRSDAGALLVLLHGGNVTRHCMIDMAGAAAQIGLKIMTLELSSVWEARAGNRALDEQAFAEELRRNNVRAVIGYTLNGAWEWPTANGPGGRIIPFFERMNIPHLMWWTDHPHWADNRGALRPDIQPLLRSPNHFVFVKNPSAARELREFLGWPHCYGLPVAENPGRLKPVENQNSDFDIVTITGAPPKMDPRVEPFLSQDDPNPSSIAHAFSLEVKARIVSDWTSHAPENLHAELEALAEAWITARCARPRRSSYLVFRSLEAAFPQAAVWLRRNPLMYFNAVEALWELYRWERTFYLLWLGKYFRVGVFGSDWTSLGLSGGGWVNHDDQPHVYSRGRLAINICQASDEEGLSHKAFHIAACGVPLVHDDRAGLDECFAPRREVAVFRTAREAREIIASLLADQDRAKQMAEAARERLCREHTWEHRLRRMLSLAGIHIPGIIDEPNPMTSTSSISGCWSDHVSVKQ